MSTRTPSQHSSSSSRPRLKAAFSFSSRKSDGGWSRKDTKPIIKELPDSPKSSKLTSKADPRKAMEEVEPALDASVGGMKTNYESIRLMQHRDLYGNVITDPDRSNPTRSRMERPLDTIRSFEAAVDGNHRRSYVPPRSESSDALSSYGRRTSYTPGGHNNQNGSSSRLQYLQEHDASSYGAGPSRPESMHANSIPPNSFYNPNRARFNQRMNTEPAAYRGPPPQVPPHSQGVYPSSGNHSSHDTVNSSTSGSGSHFADQWGYSTDPSSENSSIDRNPIHRKPTPNDPYGNPQHGNPLPQASYGEYSQSNGHYQQQYQNGPGARQWGGPNGPQSNGPPVPPKRQQSTPRIPIKLNSLGPQAQDTGGYATPVPEKRKSWFKRFSRS